ncbi:MAG: CocE/NonD family hydrolase [Wenzhouxiangella sp.]|nr:CocE/NonD family hydrolase [Wenzhouxiangella sp.]
MNDSTEVFDNMLRHERMVSMRDGVRLATDIYLPPGVDLKSGPACPVILERTPYGKREPYRSERTMVDPQPMTRDQVAAFFVSHGYVVVYQDCRGRFASEGRFTKYLGEGPDGFDTLAWLVDQPFCNGRVGTMGLSYAAHTQSAAASLSPPGLACMLLDSGGFSNAYRGAIRQGGALELKQATWAWKHARLSRRARTNPDVAEALDQEDVREWFRPDRMPWRLGESPLKVTPDYEHYLFEQWTQGAFNDYWKQVGLCAELYYERFPDIPVLHMSSWYDPYTRCATRNFCGLEAAGKKSQQLVLGPWIHGQRSVTFAGDVDFGSEATLDGNLAADYLQFRLQWFDRWLKEKKAAGPASARISYFLMGGGSGRKNAQGRLDHGGRWVHCEQWPPPEVQQQQYFLQADGSLSDQLPAQGSGALSFRYDPMHPVPTIGGAVTSGAPIMEGGGFDQVESKDFFGSTQPGRALAERDDVLVFATEPLERDVELSGDMVAELWVASDCPDTDFTVKLIDWMPPSADYPEGYALNIVDGILRVRYRSSWERPELLQPGEPVRIRIEPFPFSNLFRAGHRIRVDISSSNYPRFDLNPNSGEPEGLWTRTSVATNRVFVDAARASCIWLPVCE